MVPDQGNFRKDKKKRETFWIKEDHWFLNISISGPHSQGPKWYFLSAFNVLGYNMIYLVRLVRDERERTQLTVD